MMDFRLAYDRYYAESGRKAEALYQSLRHAIVSGNLPQGTKLPSSRQLAELYDLSRGSVNLAYDMLFAEGFVRTEMGRGTFVTVDFTGDAEESGSGSGLKRSAESGSVANRQDGASLSAETDSATAGPTACATGAEAYAGDVRAEQLLAPRLTDWARRLPPPPRYAGILTGTDEAGRPDAVNFEIGQSSLELFPVEQWRSALYAEVRTMTDGADFVLEPPEGYLPLREAIAAELRRERGIRADASRIVITNGSMQAIALLNLLLIEEGDAVVLENPCYSGTMRSVAAASAEIVRAVVDEQGVVPEDWNAKLLFVTPTRHFPTGAVLPAERRKKLLDWAARRNAIIVEDDYDSELRWGGRPIEPLKALDAGDRVVYIGTYSKTMFAQLRIGYALLPEALLQPFRRAKALLEPHPSGLLEQRALAGFIAGGGYARHMRRMRRVCGRRLLRLQEEFAARLGRWFKPVRSDAGLHLCAQWIGEPVDYEALRAACRQSGVSWTDGGDYWLGEPAACLGLFGFAHLPEERIAEGMARIEAAARGLGGRLL